MRFAISKSLSSSCASATRSRAFSAIVQASSILAAYDSASRCMARSTECLCEGSSFNAASVARTSGSSRPSSSGTSLSVVLGIGHHLERADSARPRVVAHTADHLVPTAVAPGPEPRPSAAAGTRRALDLPLALHGFTSCRTKVAGTTDATRTNTAHGTPSR